MTSLLPPPPPCTHAAPQTNYSSTATAPARETSSYEQPTTIAASQSTTYAPSQPATSAAAEGAASQQPQAHNASVVWDFNAENDDELSVKAGDQVRPPPQTALLIALIACLVQLDLPSIGSHGRH